MPRDPRTKRGLGRAIVALPLAGLLALGMAGPVLADPPQHATDNHEAAQEGKGDTDNSVHHEPSTPPAPEPPPGPVSTSVVAAATVAPEQDLLPCGGAISTDGKGVNPDVEISRLIDADKATADECDAFPYELKSIPNGLRFVKPTGFPLAQFFVDVTWYRPWSEIDEAPTVDFEAVEGGYPVELAACPASIRDPETGEVVGLSAAENTTPEEFAALGIVDQDGSPSAWNPEDNGLTQFACIASTSTEFDPWAQGGPRWKVYQRLWLMGDVIFRG